MSELLIAVTSLVVVVGGGTSVCMLTEGLKVKATGCGTGFGLLEDNRS